MTINITMSSLPKSITIFVYGGCNLDCIYCYAGKNLKDKAINLEFAKLGIETFFKQNNAYQLRLFGVGEPTLAFDHMVELIKFSRYVVGTSLQVELQTNGVFHSAITQWIADNIDILWISCDGPPDINDRYRRTKDGHPTSEVVVDNITQLAFCKKCQLGVRTTITQQTSYRQREIVEYFHSLGVKHVCADPVFLPVGYKKTDTYFSKELLIEDPIAYAEDFLRARERANELGMTYDSILTVNAGVDNCYACRGCYTNPHLTVDGFVTCCDMAFSGDTSLKEMIWGKYDPATHKIINYEQNVNKAFNRRVENLPSCKNCEWKSDCSGGCFGEALNEGKDVFGIKRFSCQATKYLMPRLDRTLVSTLGHP